MAEVKKETKESVSTPAVEPAKTAEAPKKKSHALVIVIIVLIVVFVVLPTISFFAIRSFVQHKIGDIKKDGFSLDNGNVSVNVGENQTWPVSAPIVVPKFEGGKIESSSKINQAWTITISGVNATDVNKYKKTLKSKGWKISSETDVNELKMFTATKGDYTVSPIYSTPEQSMTIGIIKGDPTSTNQ